MNPGSAGESGLAAGVDGDVYAPHRLQQGNHVYADDARHGYAGAYARAVDADAGGHGIRSGAATPRTA